MIVALQVNGQPRGDALADVQANGNIRLGSQDAAKLGFTRERLATISPDADSTLLVSGPTLGVKLNMDTLTLEITAAPDWFARNVLSLSTRSAVTISELDRVHGWINYSLAMQAARGANPSASLDTTAVLSRGPWTLRSDQNTALRSTGNTFNRSHTSLEYVDVPRLAKLALGDITPAVGIGSNTTRLVGVQWARRFELDPSIASQPTFNWSGQVRTPSTVEVLVDGIRTRTFSISPGPFDLRDLAYFGGLRNVEVILRDRSGAETRLSIPYYFASELLAAGKDSFDFAAGFGEASAGARPWVVSGQYRRGLNDTVTLGGAAEAKASYQSGRIDLAVRHELLGTVFATAASSKTRNETAQFAATLAHGWSSGRLSTQINAAWQQRGFGIDADLTSTARQLTRRIAASGGVSFDHQRSASINYSNSVFTTGPHEGVVSLRAAQGWGRGSSAWATISSIRQDGKRAAAFAVGVSLPLGDLWSVSGTYSAQSGTAANASLRASRGDAGDGWTDLRVAAEHRADTTTIDLFVQRPMQYGVTALAARADQRGSASDFSAEARFSGAVTWAEQRVWFSPTIPQAFAIVDAANVAGVRVMHNNQLVGRTNAEGKLLLPNLAAYTANQVRIDDRDIPMEIELNAVQQEIAPRLYAGTTVKFAGRRVAAVAGTLQLTGDTASDAKTLAAAEITATSGSVRVVSSTDGEGGFYLENLQPGQWVLAVVNRKARCTVAITVQESSPSFVDMGRLQCRAN